MTNTECDEDLAARAALGDKAAFRVLLDRHYDRVFRVVYSVLRNQSDAEDITQEIWAALPKKLKKWRGDAKLTSWLHRIALNAGKDALRRSATQTRTVAGYAEMENLSRGESLDTQKRLSWLHAALETLSEDLRDTAALTLGEDMNFAQAAEVLGVAEGTIAWRMSEIRKRLKSLASKDNGLGKEALA
ncbi:RNA polymerase sigma factor [Hellea balneolensis]|uniref:RNA polymerase sigma factor n=1 Tax=Hellea balneolensis TaxID=287478 RepID=UPI00040B392C|nr:RNA polymerase sigma factor [Hellea balneolensis]